jgi:prepilin-type N-terminal cleavage/methylation domain-containing protein
MRNSAFTLVELAIVIVIIGLLVSGVLVGQELIKQAEVRALLKTVESYKSAVISFEGKYDCLPGDCLKAYTFFGDKCDETPDYCNGNGNRILENPYTTTAIDNESLRFWQHLSLGNFIKGTYIGVGSQSDISGNVNPKTNFKDAFIYASYANIYTPSGTANKWHFMAGRLYGSHFQAPFLSPVDAFAIDTKIDDGRPYTGLVGTYNGLWSNSNANMPNCTQSSAYRVSIDSIGCHMVFGW